MTALIDLAKKYNSLIMFLLNGAAVLALVLGAYDVKVIAAQAMKQAEENKAEIVSVKQDIKVYMKENQAIALQLQGLKTELESVKKSTDQIYRSIEDLKHQFIQRGIDKK